MTRSSIIDNLGKIRYRVHAAAARAGRDARGVKLVAVVKHASASQLRELLESGFSGDFGENRVQEAKIQQEALGALAAKTRWRMIGHLQRNKARQALRIFDALDSLDSLRLAQALEGILAAEGKKLPVLIQVKLTDKATQSGVPPEALGDFLESLRACPSLTAAGLMGIAPELEPVEAVRPHFRRLRRLFELHFAGRPDAELSMGMSRDFEIAVEEGSTMLRIGRSIFS